MAVPCTVSTALDYLTCANTLTGDFFWLGISFAVWFIFGLALNRRDPIYAFTAASFIASIWGGMLWLAQLLSIHFVLLTIVSTAAGLALMFLRGGE